jgi:hypothetical protein
MAGWRRAAALLLLASPPALAGLGCGGDDGIATAEIPKKVFLRKADAICAETYDQMRSGYLAFVKGKANPFSGDREIREFADTVLIPTKRQEVQRLRALGAPSGEGDQVEAIIDAYEEGIERAEEDPRAAVSSATGVFTEATELAEGYGLEDCRY